MITRRTLLVSTVAGVVAPWRLLAQTAPRPDLVILHTNDVHGHVDVEGKASGLAYLAPEIRRARAAHPHTITLDAGDIIHGTPMEKLHGPGPVLGAFNAVGYDAATVGNHEFDFGPENLRRAARLAKFPLLSANVRTEGGHPWGPLWPYTVIERGTRRVGIFGLTTLETPKIQWPRTISGIRFTDPHAAARECVRALREREKVDMVLALSHLGYKPDQELAHEAPGIDLIVGGHSHTRLAKPHVENGVPIVQTGCYGQALGKLGVWFDGARPRIDYQLVDAAKIGTQDASVMRSYGPNERRLDAELDDVLTTLTVPITDKGLTEGVTPTGRFLAESVRAAHRVDVGLFHAGSFDGSLEAGPVRRGDVYARMGAYTRQHVVRAEVPGELLAAQIVTRDKNGGLYTQVAGPEIAADRRYTVAGPAHVVQTLFLNKPGVKILYDDPLGPGVREAVIDGLKRGLYRSFFA